jgi:hypothetical protein
VEAHKATGGFSKRYHPLRFFTGANMNPHAVTLRVMPCLKIECKFWLGDDGWNGSSEHPSVVVHANSFEQAKSDMEYQLGKYIESLLTESIQAGKEQAA